MRIIDLLVKMANNEEVSKVIKYKGDIYKYDGETQNYISSNEYVFDFLIGEDITSMLNDEIEIIEEEKPEKLEDMECNVEAWFTPSQADIEIIKHINKINNVINYLLNKVGDE